jgi:hypothetical protein
MHAGTFMLQRTTILLTLLVLNTLCTQSRQHYKSPEGYNLNKPYKINLPVELDEISGIAFYPHDSSVFAIVDEFGLLYKIPLISNRPINKWKFSGHGDFEDLVMIDSVFYALKSNGTIVSFTFNDSNHILIHETRFDNKGNEFETLYFDSSSRKLCMVCKDCEADRKKSLTGYFFDPHTNVFEDSSFSIDAKKIAEMRQEKKIKFKPSAAAIHPVTHKLFMVSAVNGLLVTADEKGNPESAYTLDDRLFKQPEGITFTPAGDMIISNEAAEDGVANLLFFRYQNKKR